MFPKQPLVIITHLDGSQILRSFYFTVIPAIPDSNCPFHLQRLQLPHFYHLLDGCSGEYCLTCKDGWYRVNYNKRHCQRKCPKGFYILGEKQKFCLRKYNNKIVSQFLSNCIEIGSRRVFHEEMTMRRSFSLQSELYFPLFQYRITWSSWRYCDISPRDIWVVWLSALASNSLNVRSA